VAVAVAVVAAGERLIVVKDSMPPGKAPGVSRSDRISDEGLRRLEAQLNAGARIADAVLRQWIRRYGDSARHLLRRHGCYREDLEG
jgi:hypothetical protein